MRGAWPWLVAILITLPAMAGAAPLTVSKTRALVSDPYNLVVNPRYIPGAVVDYTVQITNPSANALTSVTNVWFVDPIPAGTAFRVADLGLLNSGPFVITDGLLGLLGSGLSYSFSGLGSTTDRVDFSRDNGANWTYVPIADADGYDAAITNVRIRFGNAQAAGSAFSVRFRVKVK